MIHIKENASVCAPYNVILVGVSSGCGYQLAAIPKRTDLSPAWKLGNLEVLGIAKDDSKPTIN